MRRFRVWLSVCIFAGPGVSSALAVDVATVPVGNVGNLADSTGYGAVDYFYRIGKFEVTAGQYCAFLNAVAATDTYGLYNTNMYSSLYGCKIARAGSPGSYTYSVSSSGENWPVNQIGWGDAARFCNWLTNGQPTGLQGLATTESGSYYLNGATTDAGLLAVVRTSPSEGGRFYLPTEDEWYKAAYHKNDGVSGNYWAYPTSSDIAPSSDLADPDPGNTANFWRSSGVGLQCVGSRENSPGPYGTFDQGGNVWEWNEAVISGTDRGFRGGAFGTLETYLKSSHRDGRVPTREYDSFSGDIGFRIVEVPEPATLSLLGMGALVLLRRRKGAGAA